MTATVRVLGVPQLLARFTAAAALGQVAATTATTVMSEDVASDARSRAPVDTGALRDSIDVQPGKVTVSVPYAAFVEYGTSDTPAQPFLRPAADTVEDGHALGIAAEVMRRA